MARVPLRFIPIGALLGDNESSESLALPSVYAADGSVNTWIDKYGRATSILGVTRRSNTAVTSALDGAPMRMRAMYHYGNRAPAGLVRLELGVFDTGLGGRSYEVRTSADAGITWSAPLQDLGATYIDRIPDFAQLGNQLAVVFGLGPVKSYDGTTWGNATTPQLPSPTIVVNGVAGLLDGNYCWKVVPVRANGARKVASIKTALVNVSKHTATITWQADADAEAGGSYEVYRSTGTNKILFFEGSTPAGTLTFTSTLHDLQLISGRGLTEYGDPPPADVSFVEVHKERMFYGTVDRRWYYSDPGLPYSTWPDANFLDMTDAESMTDVSVGGTGNFHGMFVAWLERSVWTISGAGTFTGGVVVDLNRRRTDASIGAVSHRAVARVPKGAIWVDGDGQSIKTPDVMLAYLTPLGDLRLFDGNNDTVISYLKTDTFKRLTYAARRKSYCVTDTDRQQVTWVFPADGALEPSLAVTWDYRYGTMSERTWGFGHALEIETVDDSSLILAGEANPNVGGYTYLLWDGPTLQDGSPIGAQVMTKTFYGVGNLYARDGTAGAGLMQYTKRWRWVDLLVKTSGGPLTFLVEWWAGEAEPTDPPYGSATVGLPTTPVVTADNQPLVTADGQAVVAILNRPNVRVKFIRRTGEHRYLHSRGLRFRISTINNTQYTWSVVGMIIAYQVLDGLKREFKR